jgi:two-component system, OmpR family, response regulator
LDKTLHSILYVDDEEDIRAVVELSLQLDSSLDVVTCGSGVAALAYLEMHIPDLVVLDVMMPGLDGPATLAQMRARPETVAVPVIFLTAKAQRDELERFLQLGAIGVVSKPFDPMTLAQQLRALWSEHCAG